MIARGGDIDRRVRGSRRGNELEIGKTLNDGAGQRCSLAHDADHVERPEALDDFFGLDTWSLKTVIVARPASGDQSAICSDAF